MLALTPAERRGALIVVGLLVLGAAHDLWRLRWPRESPLRAAAPAGPSGEAVDSAGLGSGGALGTPAAGEPERAAAEPAPAAALDLNRATAAELDALPGIGPALARRILEHRLRYGPFHRLEELRAVRGIGPRLLERIRPRVRVGPRAAAEAKPPAP